MLIADLSANQGTVDFSRLKQSGIQGVWLKVSEGRTWDDPAWNKRISAARKAGLRAGGYHFARPDRNSAASEAAHFARALGPIIRRDLRPVLDFEQDTNLRPGELERWARDFNDEFRRRKGGMTPVFYSYPAYIARMNLKRPIGNGLWLAAYDDNDGADHPYEVPAPWKRAVAHQFTSNGRVRGVAGRVDLSHAPRLRGVLAYPALGLL